MKVWATVDQKVSLRLMIIGKQERVYITARAVNGVKKIIKDVMNYYNLSNLKKL